MDFEEVSATLEDFIKAVQEAGKFPTATVEDGSQRITRMTIDSHGKRIVYNVMRSSDVLKIANNLRYPAPNENYDREWEYGD